MSAASQHRRASSSLQHGRTLQGTTSDRPQVLHRNIGDLRRHNPPALQLQQVLHRSTGSHRRVLHRGAIASYEGLSMEVGASV